MNAPLHAPRIPSRDIHPMFSARWSPRAFSDETIAEPALLTLLEAARWAPSAANHQPWRFAYGLRGDAGFAAMAGTLAPTNALWAGKAAALVAVAVGDPDAIGQRTGIEYDVVVVGAELRMADRVAFQEHARCFLLGIDQHEA